ncbi:MAG: ATP-binding protein [Cyanobacteria bacterium J06643_4]
MGMWLLQTLPELLAACLLGILLASAYQRRTDRRNSSHQSNTHTKSGQGNPKDNPKDNPNHKRLPAVAWQQLPDIIFQQAIEHAAGGLVICDAQQKDLPIVYASPSFETLTGYAIDEVIGKNCRFLQGDETQQIGTADIRSAIARGSSCKVLVRNYRKNGQPFWNELTLSPLVNAEGIVTHYVGTQIDISHYLETFKALQQSESRYRHLYEAQDKAKEDLRRNEALLRAINNLPPTGIFVMDCHTNEALFINEEFYRIWELEHLQPDVVSGEINGEQLLTECLSNIDLGKFVATSTAQDFTDGNKIVEDEVPLLDGRTLRRIYGPIQENNSTFAYLYVFEDITERKQEVQAFARATEAAESANRAKSEFLANMSHELRSPLNAILGFTHILREADPSKDQKESLDIIYSSGEHLLALINDILDISKIEAGHVTLNHSEFDLYRLLDELQQMFSSIVAKKELTLSVVRSHNLPQIICSDRLKLRQILINLLSNAVKFTATGSITLKVSTADEADTLKTHTNSSSLERSSLERSSLETSSLEAPSLETSSLETSSLETSSQCANKSQVIIPLTFSVTDTGSGIAPEDQNRLFEAFVQARSGLTAQEGTGLGLTISYEYIRLLGGELTVESTLGQGSTFAFGLDIESASNVLSTAAPQADSGKIVGLAPGQPAYRVLVVDDVALNRKLLTHLLSNAGFDVKEACNGKEAIAQWQTWQPHLIWMDVRMPVMGGEEATLRIRSLEKIQAGDRKTHLIALTANAFEEDKSTALASGCDDFVSKPIQAKEIFAKMHRHLGVEYQYETTEKLEQSLKQQRAITPPTLSAMLLEGTSPEWQYDLTQATLDLDDRRILELVAQLTPEHQPLAQAITRQVKNLTYNKLLAVLQEAEAVKP